MNTDRETSEPTPGSEDYWVDRIPKILDKNAGVMSGEEVMLEDGLTEEEKEQGVKEKLFDLHERDVINIQTPSSFRRAVWTLVDQGRINFNLDRNLTTPDID